jgi:hypothetical protein
MAQNGCFSTKHPKDRRRLTNAARKQRGEIELYPAEVTLKAASVRGGKVRILALFKETGVEDARTGHPIL